MAESADHDIQIDKWKQIKSILLETPSLIRRYRIARRFLDEVDRAIEEFDITYPELMRTGEIATPEESLEYRDRLSFVEGQLKKEQEKLANKLGDRTPLVGSIY
jgi:hypothetical protein